MSPRKNQQRKLIPIYAIVGDGESEKIYFEQLKWEEQLKNIQIKPDLPNKSGKGASFMRVIRKAEELLTEGYDKVFCIIDFDTVLLENKVELYKNEKAKLERKGVVVLECNPCFDVWFLLHFKQTTKAFDNCDKVASDIRNSTILSDYSKGQIFQKNIYKILRSKLPDAINNAALLENERDIMAKNYPRAEVFKLIKVLLNT